MTGMEQTPENLCNLNFLTKIVRCGKFHSAARMKFPSWENFNYNTAASLPGKVWGGL